MMDAHDRYDSLFKYYAELSALDWRLLKAQVRAESNMNPRATSAAGASGLAQFMEATWLEWGEGARSNPEASIRGQARYMRWLLDRLDQDVRSALAAYNCGIGKVRRMKEIHGDEWFANLPMETREYVSRIDKFKAESA